MARIKVRRTHREELPGVAILRDAVASEIPSLTAGGRVLDLDMEVDPDLRHLMDRDPDGFFTAIERDETLGFAAAHVRARQWILSELSVLPQHRDRGAGEALLSRALAYGAQSGVKSYLAIVPNESAVQGLLLRHGFAPLTPVYRIRLAAAVAGQLATALTRLLPGQEVTDDLVARRGQADLDRIDSIARGVTREGDHVYWLKQRRLQAAFVRQGARIAAYTYGGADQLGPVAGTTQDATLAALGWAIGFALPAAGQAGAVRVHVPAPFTVAVEAVLEAGGRVEAAAVAYGRHVSTAFDRYIPASSCLP